MSFLSLGFLWWWRGGGVLFGWCGVVHQHPVRFLVVVVVCWLVWSGVGRSGLGVLVGVVLALTHTYQNISTPPQKNNSVLEEQSPRSYADVKAAVRALAVLYKASQKRPGGPLAPLSVCLVGWLVLMSFLFC